MTGEDRHCAACGWSIRHKHEGALYCSDACKRKAAKKRAKARKRLGPAPAPPAPPSPPVLPPPVCVSCGKVACPTEDAAKFAKRAVEGQSGRTNAVRYYRCPDGWWHWTRMDATLDGYRSRTGGVA